MNHYPYQISNKEEYLFQYQRSINQPELFWAEIAGNFIWKKQWDNVLEWDFQQARVKWFSGAKLNISENCIDRHIDKYGDIPAIIWESNNPDEESITLTYRQLLDKVNQFAHVLAKHGIKKGDRICIYMGMVPELAIATLACARIGAIHSVVFGGFSAQALSDRIIDASATMVITCDGAFRGSKEIALKEVVDESIKNNPEIKKVIVLKRTAGNISMLKGRDYWWHEEIAKINALGLNHFIPEIMDAEDPLFILYTSGSTGKPKGVVHSTAGYMIWTNYTFINVFQYRPLSVHFCTADIGWVTGHSYILYGPLSAGATTLMFEGIPTWPDAGRFWEIIEKHQVNYFYTAPTAIRSLMSFGDTFIKAKNLTSLKVLGSVGEPINEEAWHWFHQKIGMGKCPIVDTWWQTETGGIMISNLANVTDAKPSFATLPLPGVQPCLMDENGNEITENDVHGNLCIKFPWPGMIRTTYNDHDRCLQTYFSTYKNTYFTGDGCYRDMNGNYKITGRVDDVINVSGHRIGTAEVENAINTHPGVIESAVVGYPHEIKGQGIYAYIITDNNCEENQELKNQITQTVVKIIGPIAKPDLIQFVPGLPKTRSGKIMRRILRKIAEGDSSNLGDTTTLLDPFLVELIKQARFSI